MVNIMNGQLYTNKRWDQLLSDLNEEAEKLYFEKCNVKKTFNLIVVKRYEDDEEERSYTVSFDDYYDIVSETARNFINAINGSFASFNEYTYSLRRINKLKDVDYTVRMYIAIMKKSIREFFASTSK